MFHPVGVDNRFTGARPRNDIQRRLVVESLSRLHVVPGSGGRGYRYCGKGTVLSPSIAVFSAIAVNDIVVVVVVVDVLEKGINFLLFCGSVLVASNSRKTQKKCNG